MSEVWIADLAAALGITVEAAHQAVDGKGEKVTTPPKCPDEHPDNCRTAEALERRMIEETAARERLQADFDAYRSRPWWKRIVG
jgi:hypothetical protein